MSKTQIAVEAKAREVSRWRPLQYLVDGIRQALRDGAGELPCDVVGVIEHDSCARPAV